MSLNLLTDARTEIQKAARFSDDTIRVETYFLEGNLEMAVSQYERAFEMDPDDPGLKKNLERAMKRLVKEADVQER